MIKIVPKAQKELLKIDKHFQPLIIEKIRSLESINSKTQITKLVNREGYRLRVGSYRIIFVKNGNDIVVLAVAHRKEIYRV